VKSARSETRYDKLVNKPLARERGTRATRHAPTNTRDNMGPSSMPIINDSPWMRDLNCRCGIRRLQRKAAAHLQTSVAIGAAGWYGEALLRSVHGQGRSTRHQELCYLVEKRQQRDPAHSWQDSSAQRVSVSEEARAGSLRCLSILVADLPRVRREFRTFAATFLP